MFDITRWIKTPLLLVIFGIILATHWELDSLHLETALATSPITDGKTPTRIVSLLPSLTEILFSLNEGHRVIAVSDFDDFPPQVKTLPSVGGLITPNLETIVSLHPDLIIADKSQAINKSILKLRELGLRVEIFQITTALKFEDLYEVIHTLGTILNVPNKAQAVVATMGNSLKRVTQRLNGTTPVTLYCELWSNPIIATPGASFEGHLLKLAGGKNIATSLPGRSPRMSTDFLLFQDPEVILLPGGGVVQGIESPKTISSRPGWKHLQALRHNRVYTINHAYFSRHGPRSVLAVEEIARLLHPTLEWD